MNSPMNFEQLVTLCQQAHEEVQKRAARAVDLSLVVRNWLFGCYVVEFEQNGADRATYGSGLMDALTARLKPLGIKGVSATRLRLYRSFYREYQQIGQKASDQLTSRGEPAPIQPTLSVESSSAIRPTATDELNLAAKLQTLSRHFTLGWSHYVELLTLDDPAERSFYEIEAAASQWSVRELQRQIASSLYQRLALSRDKDEVRRLASVGQVVEKAADLISAPTVRSKQAQGIALVYNPKTIQALKGRPTPCLNRSPVCTSISSSAPRIVSDSSPTTSAILFMPTWQPSCKTWAATRCSSILSKTMFTSCSILHARSPSVPQLRRLRNPRQNGLKPKAHRLPFSHGRQDMGRLPYPNPTLQPCVITSPDNGSITGRRHSRTNTEPSWCDTELISMNDMSGISNSPWTAPSGLNSFLSCLPRALPWAGMGCPFGAEEHHAAKVDGHRQKVGSQAMNTISPAPTVRPIVAQGNALGFGTTMHQALKGRPNGGAWRTGCATGWAAPSGLNSFLSCLPRALPWAGMGCPFGAEEPSANRVYKHLQKMGAVWK